MSSTDADVCSKCGRLLPPSQQACVFGGMIVCAECDKVLRSKQAPQPAPSPQLPPEVKKGTKKNVSLRNRILAAIGIVIIAVVLWNICLTGPKYQVEHWFEKNNEEITACKKTIKELEDAVEKSKPTGVFQISYKGLYESQLRDARQKLERLQKEKKWFLKVRIKGLAAELVVMITGQKGEAVCQERIDREDMMDNVQTATFEIRDTAVFGIENENSGILIYAVPIEFESSRSGPLKPGDYSLVVKNFVSEKVIYKKLIKLPPEKIIKAGNISKQQNITVGQSEVTAEPVAEADVEDR